MDRKPVAAALSPRIWLAWLTVMFAFSAPALGAELAGGLQTGDRELIRLSADVAPPAPRIALLDSSAGELKLAFDLPALASQSITLAGETYHVLEIEGGGTAGADGQPMLPTFSRLIQIPDQSGVTVEIDAVDTIELPGYRPFPAQPDDSDQWVIDRAAYRRSGFGETERVAIGTPAIARNLRVVPITFAPIRYDAARGVIEAARRIEVTVRFAGLDLRNARAALQRSIPPSFDALYRSLVVNYEPPRDDQAVTLGSYVIICPDDAQVISRLQPLIEWRTRKGFEVRLATTAEAGSTAEQIRAWLMNAYATWENPPEYICLVGDVSGTIPMPYWWYNGAESDHYYCMLDGDDLIPEAHLGRISVDSYDRLTLYVNKIVSYESTPYMAETSWYTRACVTGDPNYSGITCVQVMQWLKTRLRAYGYTEVDTVFSDPFVSQMIAALNRGDTVFSYRGFGGVSGFGTGHIMALTNGRKMPYALTITCGTGGFSSGTCYSEAWIRAGIPPNTPTGGIAAVSTSGSTHTRYNNCVTYGAWRAIFGDGLYTFGQSLTRAKYELYINYFVGDYYGCSNFTHWNNLMGDPGGEIWSGVPMPLTVSHPAVVPQGSNSLRIAVASGLTPCAGAFVCLWKGTETWVGGTTDSLGEVELPIATPTAGPLKITVTKHNYQPYLTTVNVIQPSLYVGYAGHTIDDDAAGESAGNGDGAMNPTEAIELPVQVRNFGMLPVYGVTATLSTDDPYVVITDDSESFGDIAPGGSAWSADDFDFMIAGGAPDGRIVRFALDISAGTDSYHSLIEIPVVSAAFEFEDVTLYGTGTEITPGESAELSVRIRNAGAMPATSLTARLVSMSSWVSVTDANGSYGTIEIDGSGENTSDHFAVRAADDCYVGYLAALSLYLDFSDGTRDTVPMVLQIGTAQNDDPTGPDRYGYYAFDNTDAGYEYRPTYNWIEIDPYHGGSGIDVGLVDAGGWYDDDSQTVDLPFPFTYYGQTFTRATICSNGWMAMGSTYLSVQLNWTIPGGAGAPPYMIAAMWDDLYQTGTNRVYHWFDAAGHRYVVQWSRVTAATGGMENFEIILYDPACHPTPTGDGMIDFQFDAFNNSDYTQQYSTTGIENGDQTDGVLYGYYNRYNAGATPILTGRAIRFVALPNDPCGTLSGSVLNATNGGTPLAGATVSVVELSRQYTTGADGGYSDNLPEGVFTLVASHPSFASDTLAVEIAPGESTAGDFALEDIQAPLVSQTTLLPNTSDTLGPYIIQATVTDASDLSEVTLVYDANNFGWVENAMTLLGNSAYRAEIPGQPYVTRVRYFVRAVDAGGLVTLDPPGAPDDAHGFWVLAPLFSDDMESGGGDWTHYHVSDGFGDEWHLAEGLNHSNLGRYAWKFGSVGPGMYAPLGDGALETPPVDFDGRDAVLTFWHVIAAETFGSRAYDGGLVERSVDGGPWTQLSPLGGYEFRIIRRIEDPGPFPDGTGVYSGNYAWRQAQFRLTDLEGPVSFRFRFGSDGINGGNGWYIDDIEILPDEPDLSDVSAINGIPRVLQLHASAPNPLSGDAIARITFDLPQEARVRLAVFDVGGRRVRELRRETMAAGTHRATWNGRDEADRSLGSGVYFYILETGGKALTQRTLLIR